MHIKTKVTKQSITIPQPPCYRGTGRDEREDTQDGIKDGGKYTVAEGKSTKLKGETDKSSDQCCQRRKTGKMKKKQEIIGRVFSSNFFCYGIMNLSDFNKDNNL